MLDTIQIPFNIILSILSLGIIILLFGIIGFIIMAGKGISIIGKNVKKNYKKNQDDTNGD